VGGDYATASSGWIFNMAHLEGNYWLLTLAPMTGTIDMTYQKKYPVKPDPAFTQPNPPKKPAPKASLCTIVIDVRGLNKHFERAQTSFVFDARGQQLWPDEALIKGVTSQIMTEGNLHTYIDKEQVIRQFANVTRLKALRVQATKFAPSSQYITDAVLGPDAAQKFKAAGKACRLIYLLDKFTP